MAKFKYKFNTIKDIKKRFEKKVQKELAVIELEIVKKRKEILEIEKLLKLNKAKKIEEKSKKTNELHFYEKYESYLNDQKQLIENYISDKMIERDNKRKDLVQKSKETKTFEKLEEKHYMEFIKSQDNLEQKELDDFAVKEYLRG